MEMSGLQGSRPSRPKAEGVGRPEPQASLDVPCLPNSMKADGRATKASGAGFFIAEGQHACALLTQNLRAQMHGNV